MALFEEERDPEYERARKRAMYLLGSRPYSTAALREKLLGNYSEKTAERVIEDMTRYGFLDDEDYAKRLASSIINGKKYGLHRAKAEMRRKGVPDELIEQTLSEYSREDMTESLTELVRKKYSGRISDRDERQKVIAALARRGYGFGEIKAAITSVLEELDDGEE